MNDKESCQQVSGTDPIHGYCLALTDVLFQNVQGALNLILTHTEEQIRLFLKR